MQDLCSLYAIKFVFSFIQMAELLGKSAFLPSNAKPSTRHLFFVSSEEQLLFFQDIASEIALSDVFCVAQYKLCESTFVEGK